MKTELMEELLDLPEGINATVQGSLLKISGKYGDIERNFRDPKITIGTKEGKVLLSVKNATKREKMRLFTMRSHVRNMIKGASEGHNYRLKICSGHFPMNVSIKNDELVVKNFIGEKIPRKLSILKGVKVNVNGDIIEVSSVSKENAGNVASSIELLTKRPGFDKRIFQDGIYIIHKDGKDIV